MVTNRVDKILVGTGAQAATVAAATAGQHVALVEGEANNTPITDQSVFQIVLRKQDGTLKYSGRIRGKDIKSVKVEPSAAVVEQVSTVTFVAPVADVEYQVSIVNKSDKEILARRQDKRTYQVIAVTGETATTLAAKFAALINADSASSVVATAAAAVLTLTSKAKVITADATGQFGIQNYFSVGSLQVTESGPYQAFGTVAQTVDPNFGSGTFPQVRTMEADALGYDGGSLNRTLFPIAAPSFDSVAGTGYNLVVIEYDNNYWSNSVVYGKVDSPITLVFAASGATTAIETLFAAYLPVVPAG